MAELPQKRFYRQRAHSNPLAHHEFDTFVSYLTLVSEWNRTLVALGLHQPMRRPLNPAAMDWSDLYPAHFPKDGSSGSGKVVEAVDIGCGYGGLLCLDFC